MKAMFVYALYKLCILHNFNDRLIDIHKDYTSTVYKYKFRELFEI